jgi:adenine-specific DNA-methyltransferase
MTSLTGTAPLTEGIKYAGSKLKLLPHLLQLAQKVKPQTVFDGFSGTTRCLFDHPELFGKAKRRADTSDVLSASVFEEYRKDDAGRFIVVEAIERLLRQTKTKHIILSYSSSGRSPAAELNDVIRCAGKLLEVVEVDYKRNVMGGMRWTNEWVRDAEAGNREFLFLIEK